VQYAEDIKYDDQAQRDAEKPQDESSSHNLLLSFLALPRFANTIPAKLSLTEQLSTDDGGGGGPVDVEWRSAGGARIRWIRRMKQSSRNTGAGEQ